MPTHTLPPRYWAYLVRAWQEPGPTPTGAPAWRFIVEDPHTTTRYGFASFDTLIAFLADQLGDPPGSNEPAADEPAGDRPDPDRPA